MIYKTNLSRWVERLPAFFFIDEERLKCKSLFYKEKKLRKENFLATYVAINAAYVIIC